MITKSRDRLTGRFQFRARISVSNTERSILEEIQQAYGGILANQAAAREGWSHAYQLLWTDARARSLLASVSSFLEVKWEQAVILAAFLDHKKGTRQRRNGQRFAPLPPCILARREGFYRRIKGLNAKGCPEPAKDGVLVDRARA